MRGTRKYETKEGWGGSRCPDSVQTSRNFSTRTFFCRNGGTSPRLSLQQQGRSKQRPREAAGGYIGVIWPGQGSFPEGVSIPECVVTAVVEDAFFVKDGPTVVFEDESTDFITTSIPVTAPNYLDRTAGGYVAGIGSHCPSAVWVGMILVLPLPPFLRGRRNSCPVVPVLFANGDKRGEAFFQGPESSLTRLKA